MKWITFYKATFRGRKEIKILKVYTSSDWGALNQTKRIFLEENITQNI